jgi:signal transduction histidine kinase
VGSAAVKSFNKLLIVVLIALALVLVVANLLLHFTQPTEDGKPYMVDINRAYAEIERTGDASATDASAYDNLKAITYLPKGATQAQHDEFFAGEQPSVIRAYDNGYLRFDYTDNSAQDLRRTQLLVNGAIIVMAVVLLAVLMYLRIKLIKPFERLSDMPQELAKGHLTGGLKTHKSRYFGKFIWGLDLLREMLEARKASEIALSKENRSMVLALSHDIKTPLSAIRLYSKALSENLYDDEGKGEGSEDKRTEITHKIDEKAAEIEGLVCDIIQTSKEDFLHLEVNNEEFYLAALIDKTSGYYAEKLALIKCDFIVEPYRNRLLVGDIERYNEVLENIIENATKYGDGCEIRISFPIDEDHQVIRITNTGNTLPDGESVHIWTQFWRGSNAGTETGSGLGLYICRHLMTAMGGDIYAEPQGSNMSVVIIPKEA